MPTTYAAMKRKSERERIAALFEVMAGRVGAQCTRDRYEIDGPREISLHLTKDGCAVNVDLHGDLPVSTFMGHWFFDDRRGRLFAPGFDGFAGAAPRAHHKATSMAEDAESLCGMIEGRLMRIDDGTAFVSDFS